jgi:hypothetical protein
VDKGADADAGPIDWIPGRDGGQASVELVAILPALIVSVLVAAQVVAAGWALWTAANAARAGARAAAVGGDAEAAARSAIPDPLRGGARIQVRAGKTARVSVPVPALFPGARMGAMTAAARLDAGGG